MTHPGPARLVQAVQTHCHIADARHAGELTLCTYLLQMREYFRWERGLPFGAPLPREDVGAWIAEREALWDELEARPYEALRLDDAGRVIEDPFDADAANAYLLPRGWVYGAGRVGGHARADTGRPVFFLGELHSRSWREGLEVLQAGRELARGLAAPPAALAGGGRGPIVIRRDALARWCWQGYEAHALRRAEGSAWHAVVQAYRFDELGFDAALPGWLDDQVEVALLHELGEFAVGQRFGAAWGALGDALPSRRAQLHAAALRDHLADLERTLPALLAQGRAAPLHAWFSAFDGVRAALFPRLAAAYRSWTRGDGDAAMREAVMQGTAHFRQLAEDLLALHAREGDAAAATLEQRLTAAQAVCGQSR